MVKNGFFAYPNEPHTIGATIQSATNGITNIKTWKALDIIGHFVADEVLNKIDVVDFLIADITVLNFNVTYEIGYAIGKRKPILLVKNSALKETKPSIQEVGIFDTLGYKEYQNSSELKKFIEESIPNKPLDTVQLINQRAPVYLLETQFKTDWATRITSCIKKARFMFRTFDPNEAPRLSAHDAITNVSQSHGIVVPLLSNQISNSEIHNLRGAFIAGLAHGMNKALCLLQEGDSPVPMDYRDLVKVTYHPNEINEHIQHFATQVMEAFQEGVQYKTEGPTTFLHSLNLGASSAENEMRNLEEYYLKTDQFLKANRGEAHLVVGRKGSGKSAIFLQIRDKERNKSKNVVLDLKPEGYKLIKFKELILNSLQEGTYQHTIMAFWEYVLLLEICYKILEGDKSNHLRNHNLYEPYNKLSEIYKADGYNIEGDFSERMSGLMEKITTEYRSKYGDKDNIRLSQQQITEILYSHDVKQLTSHLANYLQHKETVWLLFDNIDKGWPTHGIQHEDLLIIRTLIDATRKIERQFTKNNLSIKSVIFLRNDVYELLVQETSDRGKEANVLLDWNDADLLRQILKLRILSNNLLPDQDQLSFEQIWPSVCISHIDGEESSQYLIERSLFRPRFLLNLVNQCKSFAINLDHKKIEDGDIRKGLAAYSTDLLTDISFEIRDILPAAEDVLYAFIGSNSALLHEECEKHLLDYKVDKSLISKIIELLLWYGFLGVRIKGDAKYIYNFNYNIQLLNGIVKKEGEGVVYTINPAFWEALLIKK